MISITSKIRTIATHTRCGTLWGLRMEFEVFANFWLVHWTEHPTIHQTMKRYTTLSSLTINGMKHLYYNNSHLSLSTGNQHIGKLSFLLLSLREHNRWSILAVMTSYHKVWESCCATSFTKCHPNVDIKTLDQYQSDSAGNEKKRIKSRLSLALMLRWEWHTIEQI